MSTSVDRGVRNAAPVEGSGHRCFTPLAVGLASSSTIEDPRDQHDIDSGPRAVVGDGPAHHPRADDADRCARRGPGILDHDCLFSMGRRRREGVEDRSARQRLDRNVVFRALTSAPGTDTEGSRSPAAMRRPGMGGVPACDCLLVSGGGAVAGQVRQIHAGLPFHRFRAAPQPTTIANLITPTAIGNNFIAVDSERNARFGLRRSVVPLM